MTMSLTDVKYRSYVQVSSYFVRYLQYIYSIASILILWHLNVLLKKSFDPES